ncbi:MAG TPA: winged helix-turn-helix domain-containing protein [Bacteroidia bacterium]|nr:winged helix-turn-helix domain-containing protein [Bacteroidia bacterium]
MKYRSRSDIIELLLNAAAGGGATKTKLMYSAFISFNQLKEYLSLLAENGLIQYEEETHSFRTTEKGIQFLKLQNKIDEVAPISFISEK